MAGDTASAPQFGALLRQLRLARGLSLRKLAERVPCTHPHIIDMESGRRSPSSEIAALLDSALGADGELEDLARASTEQPSLGIPQPQLPSGTTPQDLAIGNGERTTPEPDTVEMISRLTREDLSVDRRQAIQSIGGMVFGAALLDPVDRWLIPAQRASQPRRSSGSISEVEVQQLEQTAMLVCRWDDQFGGGLRRKAVIGQLNEVAELLKDSHMAPIGRRLHLVMAQLAKTAATMSWDSGNDAAAQRYYVLALQAAKDGGDRAFGASVLASMARQLLYLDRAYDAAELVRLALEGSAGQVPATLRAMLHTREAWAYAKQGRLTAFRRTTDKAQEALDSAGSQENPHWIDYFDAAELAGVTGGRLLELAHHNRALAGEAAEHIERAVQLRGPGHLRSLSLDKVGVAEVRLLQGELEEAARLGYEAAETAEQTTSDRVRVKLAEFYQLTGQHDRVRTVVALRDRMRPLLDGAPSERADD